jgi:hypothetical protein
MGMIRNKLNLIALLAMMGLVAAEGKSRKLTVEWQHITLVSVLAFVIGWLIFGLLGAIILAIIVMVLMGIIKYQ